MSPPCSLQIFPFNKYGTPKGGRELFGIKFGCWRLLSGVTTLSGVAPSLGKMDLLGVLPWSVAPVLGDCWLLSATTTLEDVMVLLGRLAVGSGTPAPEASVGIAPLPESKARSKIAAQTKMFLKRMVGNSFDK